VPWLEHDPWYGLGLLAGFFEREKIVTGGKKKGKSAFGEARRNNDRIALTRRD
jgi:hypothetical protein